ncbi:MAG: ABC transporter permease [Ignavibacteriales bacterium]|nr:ABC transporter permease [Ignavibacteriales bacterium]MCF8317015.1 ABC transporter permease [Ignavibacteriales bacterium]MCF8438613.1 ABC transporter permease [Ignavibacteriales bacterium]
MKRKENLLIGIAALKSNKTRTFLTALGIIFGVGAVISMLSIGEGARRETLEQIELLGTNNIIINKKSIPETGSASKPSFSPGLNIKDAISIAEQNPFVEYVIPQNTADVRVTRKSQIVQLKITGTSVNYSDAFNLRVTSGSYFTKSHVENYSNVCVLGSDVAGRLFRFESAVNKQIKINDLWFTVTGVFEKKKTGADAGKAGSAIRDYNNEIVIPITTFSAKIDISERGRETISPFFFIIEGGQPAKDRAAVERITIKVKKDYSIAATAKLTQKILKRKHYGADDFEIIIPEALLEQKQKTQRIFNVVMGAIAGISLLVGGIGIMNIMLANILERTKEIGIRRAIGATRSNIMDQFLSEAIIISVTGGLTGIIVGFVLTSLISTYAGWRTVITPFSIILAFFVSAGVGMIFGIYPAKKAANKDPIESLRYE